MLTSSFRMGMSICLLLLLVVVPAAARSTTKAEWEQAQLEASAKSELIMQDANKHKGLLAQFQVMRYAYNGNKDPAFHVIFGQYLSWYLTFIGDYPDASSIFSIKQAAESDDHPSPLSDPAFTAKPAAQAIAVLAKDKQAVFFNEAHNVPLTRTLTVEMLPLLRAEGFTYFAAETLYQTDTGLQARGYPIGTSGFYTQEPICAEMVRTALKLGFKVVAYEATSNATGDAREAEQARNLYQEVFKKDPHARLVVDAGYAHIQTSGVYLGGQSMAEHLKRLSGISPLTVEQTMLFPRQFDAEDHPYYTQVMAALKPATPIVFVSQSGKPWSLRTGYDVSVFFPPQKMMRGRPTWLALGGERFPYTVDGQHCARSYPCLVEAFYANEGMDAIPADRLVIDPTPLNAIPDDRIRYHKAMPDGELYLRPGSYKLRIVGESNQTIFQQNINVTANTANSGKSTSESAPPVSP